jgi:predicted ribosome quality control (RQC) complex YloA/Tae2 family protein
VVGRNEEENQKIQTFSREGDILLRVSRYPGPLSLLRGDVDERELERAAAITVHYSKAKGLDKAEVIYERTGEDQHRSLFISPISNRDIEALMINE